jgi:hypothetical protein
MLQNAPLKQTIYCNISTYARGNQTSPASVQTASTASIQAVKSYMHTNCKSRKEGTSGQRGRPHFISRANQEVAHSVWRDVPHSGPQSSSIPIPLPRSTHNYAQASDEDPERHKTAPPQAPCFSATRSRNTRNGPGMERNGTGTSQDRLLEELWYSY